MNENTYTRTTLCCSAFKASLQSESSFTSINTQPYLLLLYYVAYKDFKERSKSVCCVLTRAASKSNLRNTSNVIKCVIILINNNNFILGFQIIFSVDLIPVLSCPFFPNLDYDLKYYCVDVHAVTLLSCVFNVCSLSETLLFYF